VNVKGELEEMHESRTLRILPVTLPRVKMDAFDSLKIGSPLKAQLVVMTAYQAPHCCNQHYFGELTLLLHVLIFYKKNFLAN